MKTVGHVLGLYTTVQKIWDQFYFVMTFIQQGWTGHLSRVLSPASGLRNWDMLQSYDLRRTYKEYRETERFHITPFSVVLIR